MTADFALQLNTTAMDRPIGALAGRTPRIAPSLAVVTHTAAPAVPKAAANCLTFSVFYNDNYSQLVIAFQSALGDHRLAEDTAQEALLRACQRWAKISGYDNPAGWCYRVGMNWATSRWRKRRREISVDEPRSVLAAVPHESMVDETLLGAVQALPLEQRQVVVLRIWLDWSVRDTAEALDIPEGTVRSRQARAILRLRGELTGQGDMNEFLGSAQ